MLLLAYLIEAYYTSQFLITRSLPILRSFLPPITGDIINLQTALWNLTMSHVVVDDSRARLEPEDGGLGYKGVWTTREGLVKTYNEHKEGKGRSEARSDVAGVSFGFKKRVMAKNGLSGKGDGIRGPVEVLKAG